MVNTNLCVRVFHAVVSLLFERLMVSYGTGEILLVVRIGRLVESLE